MRPDNRKRRGINWSSLIGWVIFILVIAGGPLFNLLRRALGGAITLPANLPSLIPLVIGGLVVLSIVVSAVRALGSASRAGGAPRLPTNVDLPPRSPSTPMPPATPRSYMRPSGAPQQRLPTPRFDPVVNPTILVIGILGLLGLGGAALFLLAQGGP